jgi:hypothetical protein
MWRFYLAPALVWLGLAPPLFTDGACTAEFEFHSARIAADRAALLTLDDCRRAKPRFLDHCGPGPLVYARVPVNNWVCRLYRDDEARLQLHYDDLGRLLRVQTDMNPFKFVRVPYVNTTVYWAR